MKPPAVAECHPVEERTPWRIGALALGEIGASMPGGIGILPLNAN